MPIKHFACHECLHALHNSLFYALKIIPFSMQNRGNAMNRNTYFWIEHRALGRYSQMALYFYECVYDDSFSSTCWADNHCAVTRRHRLIQLNDFVLLIFFFSFAFVCVLLLMWFHVVEPFRNKIGAKNRGKDIYRKKMFKGINSSWEKNHQELCLFIHVLFKCAWKKRNKKCCWTRKE